MPINGEVGLELVRFKKEHFQAYFLEKRAGLSGEFMKNKIHIQLKCKLIFISLILYYDEN